MNWALHVLNSLHQNNLNDTQVINDNKLIRADIQKTKELLRNAVSHAPLIDIKTVWDDNSGGHIVNTDEIEFAIEAGPEPKVL